MQPADAVLKFLESVGRRSDAEFYLQLFRAAPKERFATIAVDATTLEQGLDAVLVDLRFLSALELTPLVVLGLHVPDRASENAQRLVDELTQVGVAATRIAEAGAETMADAARDAARAGRIPVLVCEGPTEATRVDALGVLLSTLRTRKLIFLRREGGIRLGGALVSLVNLSQDYDRFAQDVALPEAQRHILRLSHHLVFQAVPHRLLVSLTSPFNLLQELFTVHGAGTLMRRGADIRCHHGLHDVDRDRLKSLIESGFERPLTPDFLERPVSKAYVEACYRGVALVVDIPLGGYLTKVAVTREAQGEGIGSDLWARLTDDYPTLIWRARQQNTVGSWYGKLCDGFIRQGPWTVFFRGLAPDRVPDAVAYALSQPVDFLD